MRRFPHTLIALLTAVLLIAVLAPPASASAAWVWPVSGKVITPYRNGTDPYAAGQHRGIDIAASVGTRVVAAAGGDVRFAGTAGSSGLTISIRTADGYDTSYLHLSSLAVRAGAHVSTGERIGAVGTTGVRSATAPHLHFGVRDAGTRHAYHDPLAFLPPPPPGAPEPPAPAPAPSAEPAPPAAAPVVAPVGVPAPNPARRAVSRRADRTAPHRAGHAAPHHARQAAPHPMHHLQPTLLGHPRPTPHVVDRPPLRPERSSVPHAEAAGRPDRAPQTTRGASRPTAGNPTAGLDDARAPASAHPVTEGSTRPADALAAGVQRTTPTGQADPAAGFDLAWAAACAGLLLAAALLGLTADHRASGASRGRKLLAALHPLVSRR